MELELKHLAPYLPYGLKVQIDFPDQKEIGVLKAVGLHPFDGKEERITVFINTEREKGRQIILPKKGKPIIKPILRPLSDFTTRWMNEAQMSEWMAIKNDPAFGFDALEFNEYGNLLIRFPDHQSVVSINFEVLPVIEFLLKNHFDLFGLIPAGLAIDINTLNQ